MKLEYTHIVHIQISSLFFLFHFNLNAILDSVYFVHEVRVLLAMEIDMKWHKQFCQYANTNQLVWKRVEAMVMTAKLMESTIFTRINVIEKKKLVRIRIR